MLPGVQSVVVYAASLLQQLPLPASNPQQLAAGYQAASSPVERLHSPVTKQLNFEFELRFKTVRHRILRTDLGITLNIR